MHHLLITFFAVIILLSSFPIPNCLAETTWQAIGPFGGTIRTIAIDPTNSQTLYAGTESGVFKSTNGGGSWTAANGELTITNVMVVTIDPTDSQTIYAGTSVYGVYKSTNGGESWIAANSGLTETSVSSLAIDPTNSQTIYAGTSGGKIYKSTSGGESWGEANSGLTETSVYSLTIDPNNSQTIYAGTSGGEIYTGGKVYKSTNGGESWTDTGGLTGYNVIIFDDQGNNVGPAVYCLAIDPTNSQTIYAGTSAAMVYKSTNGGESWTATSTVPMGMRVYSLTIDPTNSQTIYAGAKQGGILKSTNGGLNWSTINSEGMGESVLFFAIDPTDSQTIYAGTSGYGVYKSTNGGGHWRAVNNGITDLSVTSLAIDPTNSQTIYAGTYDNGVYKSTNSGGSWTEANSGRRELSISSLAINPTNSQIIYAGKNNRGVDVSTDGGGSWFEVNDGIPNTDIWVSTTPKTPVWSLAIDPTNSQTIYAGTKGIGVYKSANGGIFWTAANTGLMDKSVWCLAIDPTDSQTIYAGTSGGGAFKSTNGGGSWTAVNSGLTNTYVYSLAIDPTNNQTIYAGMNGAGVVKSTNGGGYWTTANSGLPSLPALSLAIDPTNSQTIYAGIYRRGVFKSTNGGRSWTEVNTGLTGTDVRSLAIDPTNSQTIYAGDFGYGVFKALLSNDFPVVTGTTTFFSEGVSGTFRVTASGWPPPQFTVLGELPPGVTFDTQTGIVSGTPAIGSAGTYTLIITATNGIPPDAVRGITLTVLPATSLVAIVTSPEKGSGLASPVRITGTASGTGLSKVEVQVTDGTYYLQANGTFAVTPTWLTASDTTSWSLNTSAVLWREGITYTIQARASGGSTTSTPSSSTFAIAALTSRTGTTLSMTLTPDTFRAGNKTTLSGSLVKADTTSVSGQPVTLIITPPSTAATPNPSPVITTLTTDSTGTFTSGALSLFAIPGVYMVQARFEGSSTLASSFAFQALGVTPQSGYAIIVTGKASDNSLLDMHTASTDTIYSTLVNKRGFLPENITYLKSTTSTPVTRQQIQDAITVWAKNKLVSAPGPLYIIMIDHGSTAGFILDSDTLTPDQLKEYLDTLETDPAVVASGTITAHNRIIMVGSCYSGIFAKLSKPGRVVITSANTDEQSIAGFSIYNSGSNTTYYGGEYFIDALFSYLGRGDSLKDSFTQSSNMVELRDPRKVSPGTHANVYDTLAQHPLLDDNGDNKASYLLDTDGALAANLHLGVGIRSLGNPADITAVTETTTIPATQTGDIPLWLRVNDNSRIAKAWMEIRTPITTVTTSGSGQVIPHLITLPLYYDGFQWNGSYNFPNAGKYNILYYTQDNQTNDIAPAKNSVVYRQLTNNTAPAGFTLISPNDQEGVSGMFPLTWQEVTSPNKITYTLQVAINQDFATEVYKEENIPQAATYMPKDALKKPGTNQYYCQNGDSFCYWKVTAIDSFGAMSESNTRSFTIVSTNALPGIIKGAVRDATTGTPIAGATVTAGSSQFNTLSNGGFIMMQPSGSYTVTATANGYQTKTLPNISITPGMLYDAGMSLVSYATIGDLNGDGKIDLADAILALQVMSKITPAQQYYQEGDVNSDGKIGIPEVIYILQKMAGVR